METGNGGDAAPQLANGRYRLVAILGEGGQATVYRAWDRRLGVWRAVKVLTPGSPRALRARFDAEARTLARLKHPNLLVVHDVGEDGERAYMVMALASESLADRLNREGPLPAAAACSVAVAVADALSVAHAAGVVHRDIKPHNILADEQGRPLLSDFGIARVLDDRRTRADASMGTPMYMAPEQRGGAATVDARADIYALGATLYASVVGHEPVGPIEDLVDGALTSVPARLRLALRTATARDPERRYASAAAFRDALIEAVPQAAERGATGWVPPTLEMEPPASDSEPTQVDGYSAPPDPGVRTPAPLDPGAHTLIQVPSATGTGPRRSLRLPLALLAAGVVLIAGAAGASALLFAVGLAGWWASTRAEAPPESWVGELRSLTSYPPGTQLEVFGVTADGGEVLYADYATGLTWRHPVDGTTPRARLHPEVEEPRLAGWFSEDLLAFLDADGHLALRDLRADRVVPFDHDGVQFELSPRGDRIAWQDNKSAFTASVDGGAAASVFTVPEGQYILGMAWSPDEDEIAFVVLGEQKSGATQMRVVVADAGGMMSSHLVYTSPDVAYTEQIAPIAWPWPGALLVVEAERSGDREHLVVLPTDGSRPTPLPPLPVQVAQLSARGGTLAVLGWQPMQDTWIARVDRGRLPGEPRMLWADEDHDVPVGWLPDGSLAYESDRFKRIRLLSERLDSPDVRVLADGSGVAVAGDSLVRLLDDGTLERSPIPEGGPWVPKDRTRWDSLSCISRGSCAAARYQADGLDLVHFESGSGEGVPFARLPISRQVVIALSPDDRTLVVAERGAEQVVLHLCEPESRQCRELPVPDVHNVEGIAWRTDAAGWWLSTASSKTGSANAVVAIRPDGALDATTTLEGWASSLVPTPDGTQLAFDLHRKDMDVWVADLPGVQKQNARPR